MENIITTFYSLSIIILIGVITLILVYLIQRNARIIGAVETLPASFVYKEGASCKITTFDTFYKDGKIVNPDNYIVKKTVGNFLSTWGIYSGDLVFIERFTGDFEFTKGDILCINGKMNHLAEFDEYVENGKIKVIYYTKKEILSEKYSVQSVVGKVVMKFKYNN